MPVYRTSTRWVAPLLHPASLAALLLLVVNDHWLKGAGLLPGWLTGKLSDVAGLVATPMVALGATRALALLAGARRLAASASLPWAITAAVALGFVLANTCAGFNHWLSGWFGVKALDPTDLVALPAAALGGWLAATATAPVGRRALAALALAAAALALGATSPARVTYPRDYARWSVLAPQRTQIGALRAEAWVSVTSKTGLGLSLRLTNRAARPVRLRVEQARVRIGPRHVAAARIPAARELAPGACALLYVPFAFDNNRAWNEGHRQGALTLALAIDGQRLPWRGRIAQRRPGYHRAVHRDGRRRPRRTPRYPRRPASRQEQPCR